MGMVKHKGNREPDPFDDSDFKRIQALLYLIPVFGFFPAIWTLYRGKGSREKRRISRQVVTLTLGWLLGYTLLGTGASISESFSVPLLLASSLLTSGYFLTSIWLMVQVWRRKSARL